MTTITWQQRDKLHDYLGRSRVSGEDMENALKYAGITVEQRPRKNGWYWVKWAPASEIALRYYMDSKMYYSPGGNVSSQFIDIYTFLTEEPEQPPK